MPRRVPTIALPALIRAYQVQIGSKQTAPALLYAADNIRVMAVNPGAIDTPLVAEALEAMGGDTPAVRKQMAEAHPIGRMGQPEDIARVVLFLASDQASFMTGSYVNVDGGLMAKGAWA